MPVVVPAPANMNYANMIEEKNLKKTFIIATLVSTLVGTFAASHNLYERFTQKKKDGAQDEAIKNLGEKVEKLQVNGNGNGSGGGGGGGNGNGQGRSEELKNSLDTSGALIRREYDIGYDRLGRRFAIGDLITENELQKQVIMLQQTVIRVLEEAMYNNRAIDPAGLDRLVYASRTARHGSLDALQGQYQRLLLEMPPQTYPFAIRSPPPEREILRIEEVRSREPTPAPPPRRLGPPPPPPPPPQRVEERITRVAEVTPVSSPGRLLLRPPPRALPPPAALPPTPSSSNSSKKSKKPKISGIDFFCRYSLDLQRQSSLPLSRNFDPLPKGFKNLCPACRVPVAVDATDMWEIDIPVLVRDTAESVHRDKARGRSRSRGRGKKEEDIITTTTTKQRKEIKRFRIPARFVLKCHTPEGDFACALCCGPQDGYSGEVVLCEDPEALVDHVAREHRVGDIENEWDIFPG